jgi:hypothetical protein
LTRCSPQLVATWFPCSKSLLNWFSLRSYTYAQDGAISTKGAFMKHIIPTKALAAVAVALGVFAAVSSAHARSDVSFSIGVQVPGIYVPVHVQPRPNYMPAPGHYGRYDDGRRNGGQHWQGRSPYGDHDRYGSANVYDSSNPRNQWHQSRLSGPYGDLDRDGVKNKWDRDVDGDVDGDGVGNRYDRFPTNPNRR